jgi:hypothetical protein
MEYDGVWWGFQDPKFVLHYQKWIDWFWQNVAPSGFVLNLLSNKAAIEKVMQEKEYANRRNIKVWKETKKFTGTLWVAGDYVITINTSERPHYLVEFYNVLLAHNLRELFKGIWNGLKK